MSFPIEAIRSQFPALTAASGTVFFDNAAGAQLPARVIDAVKDHLVHRMVQRGGPYKLSREVDDVIVRARHAVADLVNAADPDEVVFGLNGTSFMRLVSQTIAEQQAHTDGNADTMSDLAAGTLGGMLAITLLALWRRPRTLAPHSLLEE